MVATPTIKTSEAGALVVSGSFKSAKIELSSANTLVVANFPTPKLEVSQAGVSIVTNKTSKDMRVSQAGVFVVARGRVYSPKLRAWTYTLDGHDFYVLRLGEGKTLIYDLATSQWSWFSTGSLDLWRPLIGFNWYSAGSIPNNYGSNIVAGDDSYGHLWVLDPEKGTDDNPSDTSAAPVRFERIATGQVVTKARNIVPIYRVTLSGSFGSPVAEGDTVTHSYSDDAGVTYKSAGNVTVTIGDMTQDVAWRSLGRAIPGGRLFRITDDGAFARIDSLDVNYEGGNDGG